MLTWKLGFAGAMLWTLGASGAPLTVEPSPERDLQIQHHNSRVARDPRSASPRTLERPFSDLEDAGYVFFSADTEFGSKTAKLTMAKELPSDVTLVIYAAPGDDVAGIRTRYRSVIDDSRLKIASIPDAESGFWSRDGLPIPVWNSSHALEMVDAQYYHGFEPDQIVAGWFSANLIQHNYYFEGGNFMVTDDGACITVDNKRSKVIPDSIFRDLYGCSKTIRLPFEKGIGHADESVRVAGRRSVFTDSRNYAGILAGQGFNVITLPRPSQAYETYVNSLLVNGTMFVPVFGESQDAAALAAYRQAGFKVVPINTVDLANNGHGSLHCITMTYPKVPFSTLLNWIGAKEL